MIPVAVVVTHYFADEFLGTIATADRAVYLGIDAIDPRRPGFNTDLYEYMLLRTNGRSQRVLSYFFFSFFF